MGQKERASRCTVGTVEIFGILLLILPVLRLFQHNSSAWLDGTQPEAIPQADYCDRLLESTFVSRLTL